MFRQSFIDKPIFLHLMKVFSPKDKCMSGSSADSLSTLVFVPGIVFFCDCGSEHVNVSDKI